MARARYSYYVRWFGEVWAELWYDPEIRRGGRVVEGTGLENRQANASWVQIPPSPPRKAPDLSGAFLAVRQSYTPLETVSGLFFSAGRP